MASLTRWTWVWVNSGSWWWTGRPGVLWFMGSQRVGHDWATELNWTGLNRRLVNWVLEDKWKLKQEKTTDKKRSSQKKKQHWARLEGCWWRSHVALCRPEALRLQEMGCAPGHRCKVRASWAAGLFLQVCPMALEALSPLSHLSSCNLGASLKTQH